MLRAFGIFFVLCIANLYTGTHNKLWAAAKSLITAQAFPETVADLSFADRVQILADGYEVWESVFDSSGRCISGCAYQSITLQEKLEKMELSTQAANQHLAMLKQQHGYGKLNFYDRNIPLGMPLKENARITSYFDPKRLNPVTGTFIPHDGIDFAVPTGTNVYATADGVVENVWSDNKCGQGIKIKHNDGYETVYCHLSGQLVTKQKVVSKGDVIGMTGNTGRSTAPHLHYAIKHNGEFIDPLQYING